MKADENIEKNLKYLGLDLNNIPKRYKEFKTLDFRPSKYGDERNYKVYKFLNVEDIEILLTPTNRMCDITEKYSKAAPICAYLNPKDESDIERNANFLKMINKMNIDEIEAIENEQKELNKKIPFAVKYSKNYLWQIYYSEYTNKYFMLVPTEDLDYSAFFYLLKAQLSNKQTKIYVPISYMEHSRNYLNKVEIEEIQKYLCFFTKKWPMVYEVFDKSEGSTFQITGDAFVYDEIKSKYKIKINSKEEAEKFYKLVKALFILQTQLSHYYKFDIKIDYRGSLNFYYKDKKIIYEILSSIIKEEYIKAEEIVNDTNKEKEKLEKEIKKIKQKSAELDLEFIEKEKQISTFLECKKSFFGRVKYFFKNNKNLKGKNVKKKEIKKDTEQIEFVKYNDIKDHYTLEELVNIYKKIEQEEIYNKNLKLDIEALENRVKNVESKIKNATEYIEEIEKHKKSIFEFWKFTNKDKVSELTEGKIKENNKNKLKKVFNYELDFEDLSKFLDRRQREILSQEEQNSVFVATTEILKDLNTIINNEKITKKRLEEIKDLASQEKMLFSEEKFDIFGAINSNNNTLKTLANRKHREMERELFRVLDINQKTTIEEYTKMLNNIINNINFSMKRMSSNIDIPIYSVQDELETLNVFYINSEKAIEQFKNDTETETNLYKVKINEKTPILAFSNIIYFNNYNKTLPLGMNISEGILLNNNLVDLKEIKKDKINIVTYEEPNNELSKIVVKKLNIYEYEI